MSIPRAKITTKRFENGSVRYEAMCGECGRSAWDYTRNLADYQARAHLAVDHGVRTVGSLTADDIGKWIEVEDNAPFRITKLWHGRQTMIGSDGLGATFTGPSSVVCRVTEERP